jgi:hypothetical protein
MKAKTSELTGPALNWAVDICEGGDWEAVESFIAYHDEGEMRYSTDPAQAYPIIYREQINTSYDIAWLFDPADPEDNGERWYAELASPAGYNSHGMYGPTPLIAAMRTYVASKLGDEIEIPEELP